MPTVLAVGATGNIGVAAIIGALRNKYNVLAVVRNQASADKLFEHVGTKDGITTVEADITSDSGVQTVVDQVRSGKLPAFQHVYSSAGAWIAPLMYETSAADFRKSIDVSLTSNFFAYRATIPYLLEQNDPNSTWTICTGAAPDFGVGGITGITQGGLFAMMKIASKELEMTNVRVNEAYLSARVDYDAVAEKSGSIKASEFAKVYEQILTQPEISASRVSVAGREDLENLKVRKLLG